MKSDEVCSGTCLGKVPLVERREQSGSPGEYDLLLLLEHEVPLDTGPGPGL